MKMLQLPMSLNNLNHELRTPLIAILEAIALLNNIEANPEQKLCLKDLQSSVHSLLNLVDKLSSCAKEIDIQQSCQNNVNYPASNITVLLVEDTYMVQVVHKRMLENLGLRVEIAASGEEALNKINTTAYDLIFMDIGLPGMSGIETATKIRQLASPKKDTPIIALTAFVDKKTQQACLEAGIDSFESKPTTQEKLSELVDYFCSETLAVANA